MATARVVTRVANAATTVASRIATADTTSDWPISTWNANSAKLRAKTGSVSGTPSVFAAVRTMPTAAARNHTAPATAPQRAARCCTLDSAPWSFFCAGSANAATMSRPTVSAAAVSCTARATGSPYCTRSPAETSCWLAVNAPVTVMPRSAHAAASGTATASTVATVDVRAVTGADSGAAPPDWVPGDVTVMTVQS
uniref:Uncharacterized protein n=1 Tax=Neobacillus citreus TaxID=2833578 RepID=A0A942SZ09_9BACI